MVQQRNTAADRLETRCFFGKENGVEEGRQKVINNSKEGGQETHQEQVNQAGQL